MRVDDNADDARTDTEKAVILWSGIEALLAADRAEPDVADEADTPAEVTADPSALARVVEERDRLRGLLRRMRDQFSSGPCSPTNPLGVLLNEVDAALAATGGA